MFNTLWVFDKQHVLDKVIPFCDSVTQNKTYKYLPNFPMIQGRRDFEWIWANLDDTKSKVTK